MHLTGNYLLNCTVGTVYSTGTGTYIFFRTSRDFNLALIFVLSYLLTEFQTMSIPCYLDYRSDVVFICTMIAILPPSGLFRELR